MTDSVAVLSPTDRVFHEGEPVSGAKLNFYNAGTSTPKAVYSDTGLSSSLGSTVYTDSDGFPVTSSGGSTKTAIYTGTAAYKVVITDSSDTTLISLDNLSGALDTSGFLTDNSENSMPVISKTANYTILTTDAYKLINANPSGGAFTLTLPDAATAGDGWWCAIRNNGSSTPNAVTVTRAGSDTIRHRTGAATSFTLGGGGAGGFIVCDGAGFSWIPGEVLGGDVWESTTMASASTVDLGASTGPVVTVTGTTTITSFGTAPNRFRIVKFSGALTITHNATTLILPGAGNYTTTADSVIVFVSDSSGNWQAVSVPPVFATQAVMETGTSTSVIVSPGVQKFHPLHPKAWGQFVATASPSIQASSGIDSISRTSTGTYDVTLSTAMSSTNYGVVAFPLEAGAVPFILTCRSKTTTVIQITVWTVASSGSDNCDEFGLIVMGDV